MRIFCLAAIMTSNPIRNLSLSKELADGTWEHLRLDHELQVQEAPMRLKLHTLADDWALKPAVTDLEPLSSTETANSPRGLRARLQEEEACEKV